MNYMLCKRILYVHPEAVDHYLTINFAMLERSVFEIGLTVSIIKSQLEKVKNKKAVDLIKEILFIEEEILNYFFSFYEVFRSE